MCLHVLLAGTAATVVQLQPYHAVAASADDHQHP